MRLSESLTSRLRFAAFVAAGALSLANGVARADDLQALSQNPKNWPMAPRDYASTRFSPLDQINAGNAGQLKLALKPGASLAAFLSMRQTKAMR